MSSRSGLIPLSSTQDVAGPLARTVTDLALMLDATVGTDPADETTREAARHVPASYRTALTADGLKGARIGVLRSLFGTAPEDEEVAGIVQKALDAMKAEGAQIIDVLVPGFDELLADSSVVNDEFKFVLADYLARHPRAAVKSLGDILERGLNHDALDARFRLRNAPATTQTEHYRQAFVKRRALRSAVLATFEGQRIDAMAYPTLRRKPAQIGETQPPDVAASPGNCQLSATTGLPAISMPAGFTVDGLPIGVELLGGAFAESTLLKLAYAWEQSAHPRRPPFSTPALVNGAAPAPVSGEAVVTGSSASARVTFTYDHVTGVLLYDATVNGLESDRVVALTLQRGEADRPGPILAHLLSPDQATARESLTLRGRDREDLVAGKVYIHLYTRQSPLGVGRARLPVS